MSRLSALQSPRTWKIVVAIKLVALAGLWIAIDGDFQFGDKTVAAAPETAAAKGDPADGKDAKDGKDVKTADKDETDKAVAKPRKSFLANLLELPTLNPESIQKDELGKYLELAERKQRQVQERMELLKKREDQLKGLETSIDDKLKRLDDERRFFAQTIQQEKVLKGERIDKLVAMYAKMEPKKAAPVMEKLDKDLVVELFKQMPQKQVTAILEDMNPDKSVTISEYYGRVRSAREYDILKEMNQSLRKEFDDCKGMPTAATEGGDAKNGDPQVR